MNTRDEGYIALGFFRRRNMQLRVMLISIFKRCWLNYPTSILSYPAMVLPALNSKFYWQHNLPIYFLLKNDHIFPKIRSKYLWIDLGIFFFWIAIATYRKDGTQDFAFSCNCFTTNFQERSERPKTTCQCTILSVGRNCHSKKKIPKSIHKYLLLIFGKTWSFLSEKYIGKLYCQLNLDFIAGKTIAALTTINLSRIFLLRKKT